MKYIGHNQWDGLNFVNFYNKVIASDYEKVILFCQNEWEWHMHNPILWPMLQEHCKKIGKTIHIISGSHHYLYPVQIENTEVSWWDTYWIGKTLGVLCHSSKGQKLSIDPYQNVDYKYHFISMNNRPHSHRCLLIDLLAKSNLLEHGAISMHGTPDPVVYTYRYFDGRPLILEPEFAEDKNQYRIVDQYYESFAQLISESSGNTIFLSEKTAIPLLLGKPFLVASQMHYHKFLKNLGFELYEELFDYSFDDEPDEEKRYEMLLENFKKLVKIDKQNLYILQMQIANKVAFNKKHARALAYDKSLYPKIAVEAINWYEDTGNILDRHLIDDYENLKSCRDYEI
jgi:hypothetical protein